MSVVRGHWNIETINPTCVVWSVGGLKDSAVRDTVKGMVPGHICIVKVQVCFTQRLENYRFENRA